jgi:hypothetical protein
MSVPSSCPVFVKRTGAPDALNMATVTVPVKFSEPVTPSKRPVPPVT